MNKQIKKALNDIRAGKFVFVYDADGREEETDFFIAAEHIKPSDVFQMRHDGGGLIFLMLHDAIAVKLGLPFMTDILGVCSDKWRVFKQLFPDDIPYDAKSSFSVSINHRKTFTGIRDIDRALTISRFGKLAAKIADMTTENAQRLFGTEFRSPGHVSICRASKGLLKERQGHTELGIALAEMAGVQHVMAGCEMLDIEKSLPKKKAIKYAEEKNCVFLEGSDIIEAWTQWSE